MIAEQQKLSKPSLDWSSRLNELRPLTFELDWNNQAVFRSISSLMSSASAEPSFQETGLISNDQMRQVFKVSTCLGFTIWQHFAAVERLHEATSWQAAHPDTWSLIRKGRSLVGLGITHIAKSGTPTLASTSDLSGAYMVDGNIPWISGFGHFDHFVIGFAHESNIVVALVPSSQLTKFSQFSRYKLNSLNGTQTGSLDVQGLRVSPDQVLSVTPVGTPTRKTRSRYLNPELGLAERALDEAKRLIDSRGAKARLSEAPATLACLRKRVSDHDLASQDLSRDPIGLCQQRDDLIHDSVRFLTIVEGGPALSNGSLSSLLWSQVRLLDVFIQPHELIRLKLARLGG